MSDRESTVKASVGQKPKFLTFIITLAGLYAFTAWAGFMLLQPLGPDFLPASQTPFFSNYPANVNTATEWWQYPLFGLYNIAVWVGAYFIAAKIVPRFFS